MICRLLECNGICECYTILCRCGVFSLKFLHVVVVFMFITVNDLLRERLLTYAVFAYLPLTDVLFGSNIIFPLFD